MRTRRFPLTAAAIVVTTMLFRPVPVALQAQDSVALRGLVSSQEEGHMEGVVVTARRGGANFDVSVVTNAQGRYSFPRTHVEPGSYHMTTRAVGYDLRNPGPVEVTAEAPASVDLQLRVTTDLPSQLTSVEWLMNLPGTKGEKDMLVNQAKSCTYCHSLERIVKSRHNAEQLMRVIARMDKYFPDGTMAGTEGRGRSQLAEKATQERAEQSPTYGMVPGVKRTDLAAYIATINLSDGRSLPTDLETLPRPTGKSTQVIITQYDMPRKDTVSHDMDVDSKGIPWYTDQSRMFLGMMDPKTGVFTEYPLPPTKHEVAGGSDVTFDEDDNVWFPMTTDAADSHFGLPTKFDRTTNTFTTIDLGRNAVVQFMDSGPDGKVWTGYGTFYRIDPKTMMVDYTIDWTQAPSLPAGRHAPYEIAVDTQGNPYITDFGSDGIIGVDIKTNEVKFWKVPTPNSMPRRGRIDSQDRYWFAEYFADKLAVLDLRTETFQEWDMPYRFSTPYTASLPDKEGHVYTPSNTADRLCRLDPKTGDIVEYLMPTRDFDTKQLAIDPITQRAVWFANTRNARLVKVEPLD